MIDDARLVATLTVGELRELVRAEMRDAIADRPPTSTLLDRAALARALDLSLPSIDRLRKRGLPHVRLGDVDRFEFERVLDWLRGGGGGGQAIVMQQELEAHQATRPCKRDTCARRDQRRGSDTMKYHTTFEVKAHEEGVPPEDLTRLALPPTTATLHGACTALVIGSLLYPEDGSYSSLFLSLDGRTGKELEDAELWKAWLMLARQLSESKTLHESKRELCERVFEAVASAMRERG